MKRITIEMPDPLFEQFEKIKEQAGITGGDDESTATVFRCALATYELLLDVEEEGGQVLIEKPGDETKRVVIPRE